MFTKANLPLIRKDIDAALAEVAKKHGINLSIGNIRFNAESFRTTLNAAVRTTSTTGAVADTGSLEMSALLAVAKGTFGSTFDVNKYYNSPSLGAVKFVGYHPRKPKYPFIVATAAGKRFKITYESALAIAK